MRHKGRRGSVIRSIALRKSGDAQMFWHAIRLTAIKILRLFLT